MKLGCSLLKNIKKFYLQLPKPHRVIISSFSIIVLLLLLIPSEKATASRQLTDTSLEIGKRYALALPEVEDISLDTPASNIESSINKENITAPINSEEETLTWKKAKVRSGDSLAKVFKRLGYSARTTYDVSSAKGDYSKLLKKINVGDVFHIGQNAAGELAVLTYSLSKTETLYVKLIDDGSYQSSKETKTVEIRETIAHGVIKSNFWNAGIESGLNDAQIINLANIFGWDIDFALDIREGDSFHVVFENRYVDGDHIGTGKILAAEFINKDDPFQAIRFTDGEYYSPDGRSMRKAFLRAPVNFRYISSNFKPKRFHPIQKRWKAHRGTDYRANKGTPVVAAGNGKVTHSTYNKYNGNYVFIQHGNGIETKYLHFSKRNVKKGQRVKQGDVIGYVGSTGMSEASHLHYEFLLNGVHRNPRTVKLPDAKPINKKYAAEFSVLSSQRLMELSGSRQALLAMQTH
ncbi:MULTISPECIES: OapA family protein [unclassified Colwellia]|uniref:OapA family protein n=1 Tax=unclassified Colwellia TaxID=196834 RepID=UPI0015F3A487|nr:MULTISPECIES: peptidoglycan DD-metalloendopeptidase family protein [unclassified Colwellia]MBA6353799.1 peptidoglycan DD-metalloendopeptidase family protein [Colwellia sp. BRX9-1]MBA6356751.1 peptidoglycan DD-metalloendopeptidase family protein [Colwellia sp. BRX8-3]MBA6360364.1 peptidoglycan DD-metalloendopeptidase family protein [Colwellia sp. BRX8-6]MBA6368714.1 peptidoglycan DD-metalloendopeptidase family protein [Colwellia sp. BRX8-5]MBA6374510.1 peptidoglycan DD-metalloendopeptidase f